MTIFHDNQTTPDFLNIRRLTQHNGSVGNRGRGLGDPIGVQSASARPFVIQRVAMYNVTVGTTPTPLQGSVGASNALYVDGFLFSLPVAAANGCVVGSSNVTTANGFTIDAGTSLGLGTENITQLYEIREAIETLTALVAGIVRLETPIKTVVAPRLVFSTADFWFVATAAVTMNVILFFPPESGV